ncbi:MAG: hypothetical protein SGBAC_012147 [Bacillariaceae sp.]
MRESVGEYSYVEPPLSQLEIPYKMNFSSSEDEKDTIKSKKRNKAKQKALDKIHTRTRKYDSSSSHSDLDSSSSSCGSFDSHPDRKVTNREPLRVNDIISYTPSVFTMGTNVKQAVVLGVWPSVKSFPLILDTADMLPWDTHIQRIGEFYDGQIYKHPGRIKQLSSFRLYQGGTEDVTIGMKKQASNFKQMLHEIQQRAMATLRGEVNSPPRSQSPGWNSEKAKYRKQEVDSDSTSSDSSTNLFPVRKGRGNQKKKPTFGLGRKQAAKKNTERTSELLPEMSKSTESNEDSSSSSSNDDSIPLEKLAVKKPRGYRNKRLSLTKNNSLASATSPLHWGRSKPKPKPKQPPSTKKVTKNAVKPSPRSLKDHLVDVDSSDDSLLPKGRGKKPSMSKKKRPRGLPPSTTVATLNEGSDSENEDASSPKRILSKHIQNKLQNHRTARLSLPNCDTVLWSGSDDESDELTAGIDKTLESRKKRRKLLNGKDTLVNLNASKPKRKSRSTGLPSPRIPKANTSYSNKKLDIGSSSSQDRIVKKSKTATKNKLPRLPQGRITNAMLGLGSEDSSEDDDEDLLLNTTAVAKRNTMKQSPTKKKQVLPNTTNQQKKSTVPCYDADEDSENDDALLAKPVWFHNHSSERKVKSPSPSKSRIKSRPASSDRKTFPKSPGNGSRSRLVQDICRGKMLFSSPSPTPRKVSKSPRRQYELSPSSNDKYSDSDISLETSGRAKKTRSDWSSDCSVDSPPDEAFISTPSPKKKKKKETTRKVSKRIKS